ncbi:MAG: class I SAM-dependent methyltransferase [Rickettsiaceae bacterium]|nr:class I SAM-dependent methyltransferase [Rickettsiaceae bacterium]
MEEDKKVFFGEKIVDQETKTFFVNRLFSRVSDKYDLMNDLMSIGLHRYWKDAFVQGLDNPNARLLDVAGGTGDITKRFYDFATKHSVNPTIVLCDLNLDMMKKSSEKLVNKGVIGVNYVNANAENLPFKDNSFDYYTVSFGIRNFANIPKSLNEAFRVLKKGGKFMCLEFSRTQNEIFGSMYKLYSKCFIPTLGSLFVDHDSYKYLVDSIEKFPSQTEFLALIKDSGFKDVSYRNLTNGIVAIHTAFKK